MKSGILDQPRRSPLMSDLKVVRAGFARVFVI
jgi:hypothetical protein